MRRRPPQSTLFPYTTLFRSLRSRTQEICGGLYFVLPRWSWRLFGAHGGFSELRETWCRHVARRQGRSSSASKDRWILGLDPSAHDATRHSHLDLLLSRSAALGKSQAYAGSPSWRLVGRQQNWHVASPDRDFERLADDLSRGAKNAFQLDLSARPGSVRPSRTGQVPDSRGFLDVCARGGL